VAVAFGLVILAAYVQWGVCGLPAIPVLPYPPDATTGPAGFAAWIRVTHYINLFFMVLLVRSGLQILMDHPRLYWNVHCTPGTEWVRFTPVTVPTDRLYTAKEDARYLTPWIGLPGGRHTLGLARHWHFLSVLFWVLNGLVYVVLVLTTSHWQRLVPTSWDIFPRAWDVFVHYATFHLPPEPDGFYHYNALQQLSYFGVVFILAPATILTGLAMSPALVNRFSWYRRLPGNRQIGRSLHFLLLCAYIAFVIVHVAMVIISGFARNMNHIVIGTDFNSLTGMTIGLLGIGVIIAFNLGANWISWYKPRLLQHIVNLVVNPVVHATLGGHAPRAQYTPADISPFFWPNGRMPGAERWKTLAADGFKAYRLRVFGLVENPVELTLEQIRALPRQEQITLHNCIQGWSGIAQWGGLPMLELIRLVRPRTEVRAVLFYSFAEGADGGPYYDSHTIENMRHRLALLAYEMNGRPLNEAHGAPLRLRSETQLGFKMVKWIEAIEFAADYKHVYKGQGGYAEDNEFFDSMADI
jgi:DMSO/TMAO reductase YedYZ molybdopterin-dependent catalytic subunit/thiosulfate reductase cytochrome b subunit